MGFILKMEKNKSIAITICILIVTFITGYNFIYKANIKKIDLLNKKIEEMINIGRLSNDVQELQDKINTYIKMRNDLPNSSSFLSKIVDIANACGIKIDSVNLGKPIIEDEKYTFLPCKIAFTAPYYRLRFFINRLETDKKFIRVDSLSAIPAKIVKEVDTFQSKFAFARRQRFALHGGEFLKKSKNEGIFLNVEMRLVGFYFE